MIYYLIVCRSITLAQRTAMALERVGIAAQILRAPRSVSGEGCGYAVRIPERDLSQALVVLKRVGLNQSRIYIVSAEGGYQEVAQ